jgi:DNA-directed RNA polymerase I, II, and III subunit RPABC5
MCFPVRCFTCNKTLGNYEERDKNMHDYGLTPKEILNSLNISRMCCRRMFLTHVDIIDKLLLYSKHKDSHLEQKNQNQ